MRSHVLRALLCCGLVLVDLDPIVLMGVVVKVLDVNGTETQAWSSDVVGGDSGL